MARPRSSLTELARLVQFAEVGGTNIGEYLASYGEELAPGLGVQGADLRALVHLADEALAQELQPHLERRAAQRAAAHAEGVRRIALAAADQLAATAMWRESAAILDVRILLGELLVDTTRTYILLDATGITGKFQVTLPRSLLVNVSKEVGARPDLGAWVDEGGLHFRWHGGRGGLNLVPQTVPARDAESILCVTIPPPYVEQRRPPRAARRPSSWFSEFLAEMALA